MRHSLISSQRLEFPAFTRCFCTTNTASLHVLAGTLPLHLQVEKESLLDQTDRQDKDMAIDGIFIRADEVQLKSEHCRTHPAMSPYINREDALIAIESI